MTKSTTFFLEFFALAVFAVAAFGQAQIGSLLLGTVTDAHGAVIAGSTVTFTIPATGATRSVKTGPDGTYVFQQISAGIYDITVSADGFKMARETGIEVRVNESVRANVQLEVGSIATTVDVKGRAELTNTYSSQLSETIDARRVQDLPLNGRDVTSLSLLVAGAVIDTTSTSFYGTSSGFSLTAPIVNGNRNQDNAFMLDGVSNQYQNRRVSNMYPNPDAIEEFTMNTSQYSAEYGGGGPGGQLSARTKSGTNMLHGTLFEFVRNGDFNARNEFDRTGLNDGLRRNQYGWAVGGPVLIPKLFNGRNKFFWFNSAQWTPIRQANQPGFTLSWTAKEKAGDFTEHLGSGKTVTVSSPACDSSTITVDTGAIFDPKTANSACGSKGSPFPGNIIPASRLDPVAQNILNKHTPTSPFLGALIPYSIPSLSNEYQVVNKFDYLLGKHALMARYIQGKNAGQSFSDPTGQNMLWGTNPNTGGALNLSRTIAATDTWTVTPHMVVTGGFIYLSNPWTVSPWPYQLTWAEVGSQIPVDTHPANPTSICREFLFAVPTVASIRSWDQCGTRHNYVSTTNGAVRWVHGKHQVSVGGDIGRENVYTNSGTGSAQRGGSFTVGSQFTGLAQADAVLGLASTYTVMNFGVLPNFERSMADAYIQDNYRVSRKLTLNLGLRWEPGFAAFPENHYNAWIRSGAQSKVFPNAPPGILYFGDPNTPGAQFFTRWGQLAPRFGFAFDPRGDGKWAIRGGIGQYFAESSFGGQTLDGGGSVFPPFPSGSITITNPVSLTNPWLTPPYNGNIGIPLPQPTASTKFLLPVTSGAADDPYTKLPVVNSWSMTVEHSMGNDLLLRAGFVGSHGVHLTGGQNENLPVYVPGASTAQNIQARRPDQNFSGIYVYSGNENSFYNALQLTVEKRYSHGLSVLANYTFSKSTDEGSSPVGYGFGTQDPRGPQFNRGLSDFDRTSVANSSVVYDLPKLAGTNRLVRNVFGNWQASGILIVESGAPFTITSSKGNSLSPGLDTGVDRGQAVPGVSSSLAGVNHFQEINVAYFNKAAFADPPLGGRGNIGRNTLRGPGLADTDFMFGKIFPIRETVRLQFRSEFFNLFNRVNLGNPTADVDSGAFGKITATSTGPRILQFGMKLYF